MKKVLLLLLAACFIFGANAQKATDPVKVDQEKIQLDSEYQSAVPRTARTLPPEAINYSSDAKDGPEQIYVGEAHSQRSFRREDCTVISYKKDLDLISMSFMLDEETYPDMAESDGSVAIFYSADHGQTWAGPVLLSDLSADEKRNYYLSSVVYNPSGNTEIENAYGIYQGVAPDNPSGVLGDWNNQAFGASTLGGANYFTEFFTNDEVNHSHDGYFSQFGLTQKGDVLKCFNLWAEGGWSAFTHLKMEDIEGTYNGTGFDWELEHSVIDMPFSIDPSNDQAIWVGKWTFADVAADMVWSDDAMIGYAWMVGASAENLKSGYQPLLYKTTDGGDSWDNVELDFLDSEWQDIFKNGAVEPTDWLIYPCRDLNEDFQDFAIPFFFSSVGAVDANGNLQLFGHLTSHYYDFVTPGQWEYFENIGSRYNFCGNMFKFTIGDEILDVMFVDTVWTLGAQDLPGGANDSLYCTDNGWLHRLDLTKDERSEEFFLTWTDTPGGDRIEPNYEPDVKGWSYNITNGEHKGPYWFTDGFTWPFEHYWFVSASDYAYYNADDETFTVPMVNAVSLEDFYGNTTASADAIEVHYVTGITFPAIVPIPIGVDELSGMSNFKVSQNLPNPTTGITTIEISSETVAPVTIEVLNLTGQVVHTTDAGVINGNMSATIDVSNLEAGVYIYTVIIADERVSKRMIVR